MLAVTEAVGNTGLYSHYMAELLLHDTRHKPTVLLALLSRFLLRSGDALVLEGPTQLGLEPSQDWPKPLGTRQLQRVEGWCWRLENRVLVELEVHQKLIERRD